MSELRGAALAAAMTILTAGMPDAWGQATPTSDLEAAAPGQRPSAAVKPPRPGERVRVTIIGWAGGPITGTLEETTADALRILQGDRNEPLTLRLTEIRSLEVKRGGAGPAPIAVGAAAGFAWGLVNAIQATSQPCDEEAFLGELCSLNDLAWLGLPALAGVGALVGWGVGELFFPARWRSVDPQKAGFGLTVLPRVDPGPSGGGNPAPALSVTATLRF